MSRTYRVKEIHRTIQGEGFHAGRLAVFVRFTGCNVWDGNEEHRARMSKYGACAEWCDTDFVGTDGFRGGTYTAAQLALAITEAWNHVGGTPMVVFTGGEPSLQLDAELLLALSDDLFFVAVETNGSRPLPGGVDWITLSPKPPMPILAQPYNEIKVVYPTFKPLSFAEQFALPYHRYVQPLWDKDPAQHQANIKACVDFVHQHPQWRVSLQTHKMLGVP